MSTIRVHKRATATPGQFLAGLTDFGRDRERLIGNGSGDNLKEHARGAGTPISPRGPPSVWERLQYDCSDPHHVVMWCPVRPRSSTRPSGGQERGECGHSLLRLLFGDPMAGARDV
jgi:hypothetical protein